MDSVKKVILDAGLHCSYCFPRVDDLIHKLESYSHTEHNLPRFKDRNHVMRRLCDGGDLIDTRYNDYYTWATLLAGMLGGDVQRQMSLVALPPNVQRHLLENADALRYLLPGNCRRAS